MNDPVNDPGTDSVDILPAADATGGAAPEIVEVRRSVPLAAAIGLSAAAIAIAFLARAVDQGGALAWAGAILLGVVAALHLEALVDARLPLAVADDQGIRLRRGRTWTGLPWDELEAVTVTPRQGLRDARLALTPRDPRRMAGEPLTVRLALGVTVDGARTPAALRDAMAALAAGRTEVSMVEHPEAERADVVQPDDVPADGPAASPTPSPLRALVLGRRSEVRSVRQEPSHHVPGVLGATALARSDDGLTSTRGLPEADELRRSDEDWETWETWGAGQAPVAVPGEALDTVVIDELDPAAEPPVVPVIGPEFVAARRRLGLSVDQLAERTRIRPHVIEAIEVDDFGPCGGDFYARGHVRTLARVLGVDAAPLLESYDETHSDAPVDARRVFAADLAHGGGIKATRGGPNWSVLVAAVMALVLAWSVARLVMDGPVDLTDEPVVNGSGGPDRAGGATAPPVPVVISAPASGARVIVRDGAGSVVFTGTIPFQGSKTLSVSPPVRVQATDGTVTVSVDGEDRGPLGVAGSPGSGTFVVR